MGKVRKKSLNVEIKNKAKSKQEQKKRKMKSEIIFTARTRLEPRLSLSPNLSPEKNKEKLFPDKNEEKLFSEIKKLKLSPEKNKEKLSPKKNKEKLSPEKNKEKLSPEKNKEKQIPEKNKEKLSPEKNKEKLSPEKNKEKLSPEKNKEKQMPKKNKEKLSPEKNKKKLLLEKNKEKLLPEKNKGKLNIEKDKKLIVLLNADEVEQHLKLRNSKKLSKLKSPATTKNVDQRKKISDSNNVSSLENQNHRASLKSIDTNYGNDVEDFQEFVNDSRQRITKGMYWQDSEIRDLAYGLQHHGFADIDKVAAKVKNKTENDIKCFVKSRIEERRRSKSVHLEPDRNRGRPPNAWTTVAPEVLETWPNVRKWKRLAHEQMLCYTRAKDYSRPVISALCNKFYEEEPEPDDPQLINTKLIYKYMSDCMTGNIPPQLPPKESALVLDLLREVGLMNLAYDFEEERTFLKDYKRATTFKPFEVKDEFKKKLKQDSEEINDRNTVSVPEEVFLDLSRHKRLLQSFNPLMTPVWMVQKEQEHLENYFQESSVFVK